MKRLSVILLSFLLYLPLCAQFKGTVYVDTNQSGTFDKGDKPLEGVMVTDGMNVVKTDRKGRFSLSGFEKTRFISITTPHFKYIITFGQIRQHNCIGSPQMNPIFLIAFEQIRNLAFRT